MKGDGKDLNTKKQGVKHSAAGGGDKKKEEILTAADNSENSDINIGKDKRKKEQPDLELQLIGLEEKNEEYCQRLLRLQADFDNYRKRVAKEKEESYGRVTGEIILDFLNVLDNMERAFLSAEEQGHNGKDNSLREGISMIINQFKGVLKKYDVKDISAKGAKFDPNIHYAVMQVEDTNAEDGIVLEEIQKGYMIKTRVLRPSMVKVALKKH